MFSFSLSESSISLAPGSSGSVVITQTDTSGLPITYRIASVNTGFDDCLTIDEAQVIDSSWAAAPNQASFATITNNGTATIHFTVAEGAAPSTTATCIYGLVQIGGATNGNGPTIVSHPISVTITWRSA